jgi:rRNA-processing protein FCF1
VKVGKSLSVCLQKGAVKYGCVSVSTNDQTVRPI